jgi:hypothetical protein
MSKIIETFYKNNNIPSFLLTQKLEKFERNEDIALEFEYWIEHKTYKKDNCVVIEGYSALKLAELSPLLDGEGAFMLLIDLRENPQKAIRTIEKGFKIK